MSKVESISVVKANDRSFLIIERNIQNLNLSVSSSTDKVYTIVEDQPKYIGGLDKMREFISNNMQYPDKARQQGIQGSVFVSFIVDGTGAISDVQIVKGISPECNDEAIRIVKLMPNWIPGTQDGKNVKVRFVLPFKFALG